MAWAMSAFVMLPLLLSLPSTSGSFIRQVTDPVITSPDADIITSLPGQPSVEFEQRSGFLPVGGGRSLFFYFVEADPSAVGAPLTVWFNGGPGCSSLGNGGFSELGPFYPTADGRALQKNPFSWNKVSNLLFLESPAGVGFSYFTEEEDNTVGDKRTAEDAFAFLEAFFVRYPEYAKLPLFIAGESYAGHYVPQLADLIVAKNSESGSQKMNLRGFLVGNAWTDAAIDNRGAVDFWWTHALVSDEIYAGIVSYCNFSFVGPLQSTASKSNQDFCDYYADKAFEQMGFGLLNIYDIYADACLSYERYVRHFAKMLNGTALAGISTRPLLANAINVDDCIDYAVDRYLNLPAVQAALHLQKPVKWEGCSDTLDYSRDDLLTSVVPVYKRLLHSGLRILVYSGDVDAIVPVTGTRDWLRTLDLPVKEEWRPWLHAKQIGGYVTEYVNLTFATVRQAGHMVPYTQPGRALHLFSAFIQDRPL